MATYEIPLSPQAQFFQISLSGVVYNLRFTWCEPNATWIVDVRDASSAPVVLGVPLTTGADLLEQYGYLGFVGQLIARTDHAPDAPPTYANLGANGHLYYVTT